jgi:hypothetical protein
LQRESGTIYFRKQPDEIQNEFARQNKFWGNESDDGDIYFKEKSNSENISELINCNYKEKCSLLKFNT